MARNGLEDMVRRAYLTGYAEALCKDRTTGMTVEEADAAEAAVEQFLMRFP